MSLNFRIVDGAYGVDEEVYKDFEKDYQYSLDLNIKDLMKKYGLSSNKCSQYVKEVKNRTGFSRVKSNRGGGRYSKYISTGNDGKYCIYKWDTVLKKTITYGEYCDLETAKKVRDKLIDCDWDKSQLNCIKDEVGVAGVKRYANHVLDGTEYIYSSNGRIRIYKNHIYFGSYKDLETAKAIRDKLVDCD